MLDGDLLLAGLASEFRHGPNHDRTMSILR